MLNKNDAANIAKILELSKYRKSEDIIELLKEIDNLISDIETNLSKKEKDEQC